MEVRPGGSCARLRLRACNRHDSVRLVMRLPPAPAESPGRKVRLPAAWRATQPTGPAVFSRSSAGPTSQYVFMEVALDPLLTWGFAEPRVNRTPESHPTLVPPHEAPDRSLLQPPGGIHGQP